MRSRALILSLLILALPGCLRADRAGSTLPREWYLLPEKGGPLDFQEDPGTEASVAPQVQRILGATLEAIPQPASPPASQAFRLAGFRFTFGVSANGVLGALLGSGTSSVEAIWGLANPGAAPPTPAPAASVRLRGQAAPSDLDAQLDVLARSVLATGRVHDERRFRDGLGAIGRRFLEVTRGLQALRASRSGWAPEEFRVELSVDGSGSVTPVIQAGAAVNARLDWVKSADATPEPAGPAPAALGALVNSLAEDLGSAATESRAEELGAFHLHLGQARLRLGFTASGDAGIAQGSAQFVGVLCFARRGQQPELRAEMASESLPDTVRMLAATSEIKEVSRARLRSGLKKALALGKFFAREASRAQSENWRLYELNTEFDLSPTGTVGLATVGGYAGLELNFVRDPAGGGI